MAHNEKIAARIREAFAHLPDVKEKMMFGSLAFLVDNKMCVNAGANGIMCRIDPAIHDEAAQRKGCRSVIMKGREFKGYVQVDEEGIRTKKDFNYWMGLALAFNTVAKASKKTHRSKK